MLTKIVSGTMFLYCKCEYVKTEGSELQLVKDIQVVTVTARAHFFTLVEISLAFEALRGGQAGLLKSE